ncbi:hypothetical protein [Nonomuraea dietziae]|uniref:hypothetical protein n=1 Tax=Nonomuraea dietziae TaxID=65515 RepID=UPI003444D042
MRIRRPTLALLAAVLIIFPLLGNIATNTLDIPGNLVPCIWVALAVLAIPAGILGYRDLRSADREPVDNLTEDHEDCPEDHDVTKLRFSGGYIRFDARGIEIHRKRRNSAAIPWQEIRDIRVGLSGWNGNHADAMTVDDYLLIQPYPGSRVLATEPGLSAYDSKLDRICVLNIRKAGIPRHAIESAILRHSP